MGKSLFKQTDTDNLISNVRGEVGEIIESWTLMRDFYILSSQMYSNDIRKDIANKDLNKINIIKKKFQNDIISRLSELGYKKYGQVNFHFAADKLKALQEEVKDFEEFLKSENFRSRRNDFISHKVLPPKWEGHQAEHRISYLTILKGVAKAVRLMKEFDMLFYGEQIKYQWIEMRKRRYDFQIPAKAAYLMLPEIVIS